MKMKKFYAAAAGFGAALTPLLSMAVIDVTSVTTTITDVLAAATLIGVAVLGLHFGIKGYKWIKQAG